MIILILKKRRRTFEIILRNISAVFQNFFYTKFKDKTFFSIEISFQWITLTDNLSVQFHETVLLCHGKRFIVAFR